MGQKNGGSTQAGPTDSVTNQAVSQDALAKSKMYQPVTGVNTPPHTSALSLAPAWSDMLAMSRQAAGTPGITETTRRAGQITQEGSFSIGHAGGFNSEAFQREVKAIEQTAVLGKNGKPLAPNGKESNLTLRQWATVRSKAFRNWFGDWMALLVQEKMAAMKPVVVVEAKEERPGSYASPGALCAL